MKPFVGAKLSPKEAERIKFLVEDGFYLNTSDFVREAIRDKLREIKVIELEDVDMKTAEKKIINYLEGRKGEDIYPSDIMDDLKIEIEMIFKVLDKLRGAGKIKEVDSDDSFI